MGSAKTKGKRRKQGGATLRDVAVMAGVHPATVSRALSPKTRHLVNNKTATRVDNAIRKLDYTPNPVARSLRTNRTATIGVVLYDLTNPLFPPIVVGVEDRLFGAGYASLLADSKASALRARTAFETLSARQVDGFIMTTAALVDPLIEEMVEREIPVVAAVRTLGSGAAPAVVADDARGMRRAVDHLIELGHTQIVHVAGPPQISNGLRRRQAFIATMTERGLPVAEDQVIEAASWSIEAGEDAFRSLFESSVEFTAVIATNDLIAIGGYAALKSRGLACPDDVSVIGFNDNPLVDRLDPPLTTLAMPHYELGSLAADLLLERLADPGAPVREITVDETLIVRGSTAPPPTTRRRDDRRKRSSTPGVNGRPATAERPT